MSESSHPPSAGGETVHREYILGVRIVVQRSGPTERYQFEAPDHRGETFESAVDAERYADVYFDTNGFVEEGTGDRGIPPEVVQVGRDTLATYLLTRPWGDRTWVASYFGKTPEEIARYVGWVQERAAEVRRKAVDEGHAATAGE